MALEPWGPERLETGLGGSETAALMLAACWADEGRSGREVTVYLRMTPPTSEVGALPNVSDASGAGGDTACGAPAGGGAPPSSTASAVLPERMWRGVRLLDVATFNPADEFDTLIVWRSWEVLDLALSANLLLLDMHDMPWQMEISHARMRKVGARKASNSRAFEFTRPHPRHLHLASSPPPPRRSPAGRPTHAQE